MSLDLGETILQLDRVSQTLGQTYTDRQARLESLLRSAAAISPEAAIERTRSTGDRPYLAAQVVEGLLGTYTPPEPPADWSAISVDGSHIDVDRHLPVACYLMNLGGCVLTYGSQPDARFFSQPRLAADPADLYLTDPSSPINEEAITGPLLGIVRTVRELERLVEVVEECPPDQPTLALVDGTLVLWGLSGQVYKPFVRQAILEEGLLPALDRLQELSHTRPLTVAAYVSLPRTTEVVNAIRCCLCTHDVARCKASCSHRRATLSPCESATGFLDRDLFQQTLEPGWRSSLFISNPAVATQEHYGEHQVYFYYLHAGEEIARVEVPRWVAQDERLLSLGHSLLVEQCRRGQGYPVAISEAHEQAVISGADRQLFKQMVTETLERQGLPTFTSEKERSKRSPWV